MRRFKAAALLMAALLCCLTLSSCGGGNSGGISAKELADAGIWNVLPGTVEGKVYHCENYYPIVLSPEYHGGMPEGFAITGPYYLIEFVRSTANEDDYTLSSAQAFRITREDEGYLREGIVAFIFYENGESKLYKTKKGDYCTGYQQVGRMTFYDLATGGVFNANGGRSFKGAALEKEYSMAIAHDFVNKVDRSEVLAYLESMLAPLPE